MLKTVVLPNIFEGTWLYFDKQKGQKKSIYLKKETFETL